jgi:gliding motility-associated-like protein
MDWVQWFTNPYGHTGTKIAYYYIDNLSLIECDDVSISPFKAKPPNIITPNGDGVNDYFVLYDKPIPGAQIEIYNRWGSIVFKSNNYQDNWNGIHYQSGEAVPDGVYFYVIKFPEANHTLNGNVTVVR